jgi:ATP-dependent RNA helicase DHX8/PRP22
MDDLQSLELLSLVSKVTSELQNHLGISDKTLAEFVIAQHEQCKSLAEFKAKLEDMGAEFPNSLVESIDRLVLTLHPKYKTGKAKDDGADKDEVAEDERGRKARVFKGLAIPDKDVDFEPEEEVEGGEETMDDTFAMLESLAGKAKKRSASPSYDERDRSHSKKYRRSRSRSRSRSPRRDRRDRRQRDDNDSFVFQDEFGRTRTVPRKEEDRTGRRRRRNSSSDDEFRRAPAPELDDTPVLYKVYTGRVTGIKDFGVFVNLQGVRGKVDGLVHVSAMQEGARVNHPSDLVSRGQEVKVKVMKVENNRVSLSMKEVDQLSGQDLNPYRRIASGANMEGLGGSTNGRNGHSGFGGSNVPVIEDNMDPRAMRNKKRMTSPERWEIKQLVSIKSCLNTDFSAHVA